MAVNNMVIDLEKKEALENKLTELKKWSMHEHDAFGMSVYDLQIKAINQTLQMFGMSFMYDREFKAHIYFE